VLLLTFIKNQPVGLKVSGGQTDMHTTTQKHMDINVTQASLALYNRESTFAPNHVKINQ
jgi:hypothetical protein